MGGLLTEGGWVGAGDRVIGGREGTIRGALDGAGGLCVCDPKLNAGDGILGVTPFL